MGPLFRSTARSPHGSGATTATRNRPLAPAMQAHWRGKARFVEVPFNGSAVNTNISINLTLQPSDGLIRIKSNRISNRALPMPGSALGPMIGSSGAAADGVPWRRCSRPCLTASSQTIAACQSSLRMWRSTVRWAQPEHQGGRAGAEASRRSNQSRIRSWSGMNRDLLRCSGSAPPTAHGRRLRPITLGPNDPSSGLQAQHRRHLQRSWGIGTPSPVLNGWATTS